jgi:cell division inhibitor SulA
VSAETQKSEGPEKARVDKSRGWAALMLLLREKTQHGIHAECGVLQSSLSKIVNLTKLPSRVDALRLLRYGIEVGWWDVPPTARQRRELKAAA